MDGIDILQTGVRQIYSQQRLKFTTFCCCDQTRQCHASDEANVQEITREWVAVNTPTDAFGSIKFMSGLHSSKAQYIRLRFNKLSELVFRLLTEKLGLGKPNLVFRFAAAADTTLNSIHNSRAFFTKNF